ncbi:MAG: nitronate monooxygenase [Pseudomonadota bacterium]|nr:nitronate monooxygenase [Pseudomonadota bacterium]
MADLQTKLTRALGIRHPVIAAPMAGGVSTPELASCVSEAGGLGFLGCAYSTRAQIESLADDMHARTRKPFGINLFAPQPQARVPGTSVRELAQIARYHEELGLPPPQMPEVRADPFDDQMPAVIGSGARVFSFTFGIPAQSVLAAVRAAGMLIIGTATTVDEARALEAAGVDAIVAQGSEAGAHRGTFAVEFESAMIGTMALVPQVADAVSVPVIASGGIMDGRGIAAALALGASAVQMGTAFLTSRESGAAAVYKDAILAACESDTRVTRAFSGRPARGIENRAMRDIDPVGGPPNFLPYPLQNALTRAMRNEAGRTGRADYLSLWAGQGLRMARQEPAAILLERWIAAARARIEELAGAHDVEH